MLTRANPTAAGENVLFGEVVSLRLSVRQAVDDKFLGSSTHQQALLATEGGCRLKPSRSK